MILMIPARTHHLDRAWEVVAMYDNKPGEVARPFPMSGKRYCVAVYRVEGCTLRLEHFIGPNLPVRQVIPDPFWWWRDFWTWMRPAKTGENLTNV